MFFSNIQVNAIDPQSGYGQQTDVCAQIVKITRVEAGQYALVVLKDFRGTENTVLINGRNFPRPAEVNQIKMFKLSGDTKRGKVSYKGFYNPKAAIPDQFRGKFPPGNAGTNQKGKNNSYGSMDIYKNRGVALSYAVTLLAEDAIDENKFWGLAKDFTEFINTGESPVRQPENAYSQPPVEAEVPEVGNNYYPEENYSTDTYTDDIPF